MFLAFLLPGAPPSGRQQRNEVKDGSTHGALGQLKLWVHTDSTTGSRQRSLVQPPALAIFMLTVQTPSQITTAVVLSTTRLQLLVVKTAASNPTNLSSGRSTGGKDEPTCVNYSQREGISSSSRIPGCQSLSYQL